MRARPIVWGGLGAFALFGAAAGAWILSLPSKRADTEAPPIGKQEADALLAGLKPAKRQRPLIAVIGINDATETTDLPHAVRSPPALRRR